MTAIPGMSDLTFEKLKFIAYIKGQMSPGWRADLNKFGLYTRWIDLKDGTFALDAGGKLVRRLQVILQGGTFAVIQVREIKPWRWSDLVDVTYCYAIDRLSESWQAISRELYNTEQATDTRGSLDQASGKLDELVSGWNFIKTLFMWDAEIGGSVEPLLGRLVKLGEEFNELDSVAPKLAAEMWVAKLLTAYASGDKSASSQLEVNPPASVLQDRGQLAVAIQLIKQNATEFRRLVEKDAR